MLGQYIYQKAKKIFNESPVSPVILTELNVDKYKQNYCCQSTKKTTLKINLLEDANTGETIDLCDDNESHEHPHQEFIEGKIVVISTFR